MIKFPILTRWGTFINCAKFIHDNLIELKKFIKALDTKDYWKLKHLFSNINFEKELKFVSDHEFICIGIKKLESEGLTVNEQLREYYRIMNLLVEENLILRFK